MDEAKVPAKRPESPNAPQKHAKRSKREPAPEPASAPQDSPKIFGWTFNESLPFWDNIADLALLAARGSPSRRGGMGAVLIRPKDEGTGEILRVATNFPTLKGTKAGHTGPEIHAEANLLTWAARTGVATAGCTIYVTFPPCRECFILLAHAGIKQCVFRKKLIYDDMKEAAEKWGIEMVSKVNESEEEACRKRVEDIVKRWKAEQAANGVATNGMDGEEGGNEDNGPGDGADEAS